MRRRRSPVPRQVYIQWTVLYGMQTCLGTGDLLLRMCGRWENFVVHLRTSRALSEPFLSRWQYSVNSISSHTDAEKEITCSKASLHPSEQFYMHKTTSASVLIVWELIELTEYCHLLKKALKVLWKCADVPRNSPTFHTCAEGDHLFQGKFASQWTVLYA